MKALLTIILLTISLHSFSQSWENLNDSLLYYYNNGEYNKGIIVGEKAVIAAKKEFGETHRSYATSLGNLAELFRNIGQYEKAEPLYLQATAIDKNVLGETHPSYATDLNNLAGLYESMGLYEKAEPLYLQTKAIRKKALGETHPSYATSLNNLALLYESMGRYEKAEPLYLESKDIRKKILGETHPDYATSLNNLAALYKSMGRYEKAEPLYLESKEIWKKSLGETHPDYARGLNNLAGLYKSMGQYEKAEPLYLESKEIWKKSLGETHPDYANALNNLAALYESMGRYEKAEPLYLESKEIRKKSLGETHPDYAASLNNLAALYESMGQYEKAEPLYLESKEIWKKSLGEIHPDYANTLNNLAALYKSMGQYEKAEPLYLESKEIRKKSLGETHPDYAASLNNLALLYNSMGRYGKAENYLIMGNQVEIDNLKKVFTILSEKEKENYLSNNIYLNNTNNSLLVQYPQASAAFFKECYNLQLLLKSLLLADTRAGIDAIRNSTDSAIKQLFENWQTNKTVLAKQYSLAKATQRKDLKKLEEETEVLEKELNRKSAAIKKQQESIQITSAKVWKKLEEKEAAIEFVRFDFYSKGWTDSVMYAAYILRKNDSIPLFIPLFEEKQLQQLLDSAGKSATSTAKVFYRGLELKNKNTRLGRELYKLIWQPLEPYLTNINSISYSPAGKLYGIAFHALAIDSTSLLMDKYQLQQYTSTRQVVIRSQQNKDIKASGIALFGDPNFSMDSLQLAKQRTVQPKEDISTSIYTPSTRGSNNNSWPSLPGTAEEVKKIQQLFNQNKLNAKSFTQTTASEENLKALSGHSPQILHIATHGFFLPERDKKRKENNFNNENTYTLADDPLLRSGLILSGGNYAWSGKTPIDGVEDGIATAYEISQLNLSNTELVVLSACETALGDVKGSEGVFGLQRAFKMAGVKKMIVSLWQVPDKETAELMTTFYTYWMKGKTINESFTQAQADMRKKYSPFYWAAFVLVE